jgi:hypothetical protein
MPVPHREAGLARRPWGRRVRSAIAEMCPPSVVRQHGGQGRSRLAANAGVAGYYVLGAGHVPPLRQGYEPGVDEV